jgi:hypothetical protein
LTNATGFFFEQNDRLFLITSRHVVLDEPTGHRPDLLQFEIHTDAKNVTVATQFAIPLYRDGQPLWRQATDTGGLIDVAAVEVEKSQLPKSRLLYSFSPFHLVEEFDRIEIGKQVLIVGFPLGFHDSLHHLPVVRQAVIASAFGLRFQGYGYFLTDARLHRGTSGAPVVARKSTVESGRGHLPWMLLGIHAARLDSSNRDAEQDDRLNLNCTWYADVLLTLTRDIGKPGLTSAAAETPA